MWSVRIIIIKMSVHAEAIVRIHAEACDLSEYMHMPIHS